MSVYPNSVNSMQLFTPATGEKVTYTIYNLSDQSIAAGMVKGNAIHIADLKATAYLNKIDDDKQIVPKKFIKK
ncbi:T9SS type A sorting domain-containing protein [Nonlabens sp.]|uniref:T9SS type A sorting domain-containing protein n=1 Tax=Nonlabens sp. TaxID=1888209 RepID=UPI0039E48B33